MTPRRLLAGMAAVCALVVAGCGAAGGPGNDVSGFDERAKVVAAAWRSSGALAAWRAGIVPLGELTQVAGFDDRDDLKQAFNAARFGVRGALSDGPSTGTVTFPDGTTRSVALVGARTAYEAMVAGESAHAQPCPTNARCAGLVITGATLGTTTLSTNRGQATVPAWRFTVDGLTKPLVRVALAPSAIVTPPQVWVGTSPADVGVEVGSLVSLSGNDIRYQLLVGACDTDPRGLLHEEADVIVVGGVVTSPRGDLTCTANLVSVPVTVTTTAAVGDRPIVSALSGAAVVPPRTPLG